MAGTRSTFYPTALVALSIGLTLSALGAWLLTQANETRINRAVDHIEQTTVSAVIERIKLYQYGLRGARGAVLVAGADQLTLEQFKRYTQSRDIASEFPGARGFGFIRRVPVADELDFLTRAHADVGPSYTLTYQQPHEGDRLYIQYVEPAPLNNAALGFDIASEPHRRQAAQEAIDSGELRLTQPITLMQAPSMSRQSFLVLMPVYRDSATPATVEQRRAQAIGLTYAPLLMPEVLEGLQIDSRLLHLQLSDHSDPDKPPVIFFNNHNDNPVHTGEYLRRFEQRIYGREWCFELSVTPQFIAAQRLLSPLWIVFGGSLGSLVLAGLAGAIAVSRTQRREIAKAHRELLTARAIARQKAQNEALKDQLLMAADAAELGIWTMDPTDSAMTWNPRMFALYSMQPQGDDHTVSYQEWAERLYPEDVPRCDAALTQLLNGEGACCLVFRVRMPNGELRHIQSNARTERDPDGKPVLISGIDRDITLQHEIEATLRQAKLSADRASASKSAFLANMSHEIRTPLNAVLGMLQLVERTNLEPQQHDYVLKARQAARSLLGLLNDILDYSKIEANKLKLDVHAFDLDELLADLAVIIAGNQNTAEVEAVFDIDPAVPRVLLGDGQRLKQILVNLVGNALKFTLKGEVVIGLAIVARKDGDVTLEFSVKDTGIGISAQQRERIFEGFSQAEASTSRRFGGTGLGLVISNRLVKMMGGELQLASTVGVGSRFAFAVPLRVQDDGEVPEPSPGQSQAVRLLIVDDNSTSAGVLARTAQALGWDAHSVLSGQAALEAVREVPGYDVVLMDWRMPTLDGVATAALICEALPAQQHPRFIMVTAYTDLVARPDPGIAGQLFATTLSKPVTPRQLRDCVVGVLQGRPVKSAPPAVKRAPKRLAGIHVLVVEDNIVNRQVASGLLHLEGANVTLAGNGLEALAALNYTPALYDAVLMDMQMPEMDGLEATRQIRLDPRFETLPIIAMTANASSEDRLVCLAAGMNDHISKPMDLDVLTKSLSEWVRRPHPAVPANTAGLASDSLLEPWASVSGRFGGDQNLLRDVTTIFARDTRELLGRLDSLAHSGDRAAARAILHAIKGSAANVGAKALSQATARLEERLEQGDREAVEALATGILARELKVLLDASELQIQTRS